jgi:hypothetical protein
MQLRRRDGRVAEGARLESEYTLTGIVGSNPTLSASLFAFNNLSVIHTVVHKEFLLGTVLSRGTRLFNHH